MRMIGVLTFALAAILTAGCSRDRAKDSGTAKSAQVPPVATSGTDLTNQDAKDFIHHVAIANLAEIDLGKLALDRGGAPAVKKFAQTLIDDHTTTAEKLQALSADLKIDEPRQLDDKHVDQRDTLAKESGADFDRAYASAMVDGHKDLIDQLEPRIDKKTLDRWKTEMDGKTAMPAGIAAVQPDRSDNPTTTRINQFAADIYPTVHAHLQAAKALETALKKRNTTP